ncbi:MAG: UDP-N-acetylmuramoyl-L-alanine--D-glutamate ligase [Bacteroidetes bacterium]|nr:UDP-N-acetylmuramoyl-L-alanine--D-glutamate ligase [Bacteroidota bacterium]
MHELIREKLAGKKVALLGFGREGQATINLIRKVLPSQEMTICDRDETVRKHPLVATDNCIHFQLGGGYADNLDAFDLIIKSPGISLYASKILISHATITSQTDLFLQVYSRQVIGVTGTKGKSTTVSLLNHILKSASEDVILLGNIGRPAFNFLDEIRPSTRIIYELSSHQLEYLVEAPHIAVLLNLYQEHLDAYPSYRDYQMAKMNITKYQDETDYFVYNADDPLVAGNLKEMNLHRLYRMFSMVKEMSDGCFIRDHHIMVALNLQVIPLYDLDWKRKLKGDHNIRNIMAAINVCKILEVPDDIIVDGITTFKGLEHRIEFAGSYNGIDFYNDSIATIPEATIEAVKSLQNVDTLILGGFDRGIDYSRLAQFLHSSSIRNFIFTGDAGKRIKEELERFDLQSKNLFMINRFDEFVEIAIKYTRVGDVCLLSPAAASYNEFINFEFRGKWFKELVRNLEIKNE